MCWGTNLHTFPHYCIFLDNCAFLRNIRQYQCNHQILGSHFCSHLHMSMCNYHVRWNKCCFLPGMVAPVKGIHQCHHTMRGLRLTCRDDALNFKRT